MIGDPPEPTANALAAAPQSDAEWFASFASAIDVDPSEATPEDVVRIAKDYAELVVDVAELPVDLDRVSWSATWELRASHGRANGHKVKLSMHSLRRNGWRRILKTLRHELIHVIQGQHWLGIGHGDTFETWMPLLNVEKRGGQVLPLWTIHCPTCGNVVYHSRNAKEIAEWFHPNDETVLYCGDCTASVIDGDLKRDGEPVETDVLPDVALPSDAQRHVFLYNRETPRPGLGDAEWHPESLNLLTLPGIGPVTAERLGDDVLVVEDLLDGRSLAPSVREIVPSYHDDLREAVLNHYDEAMEARSADDLVRLDRVIDEGTKPWWRPQEVIGDVGPVESLCRSLASTVDVGDRLDITFRGLDEPSAAVVVDDQPTMATLELHLDFDRPVETYGDVGRLVGSGRPYIKPLRVQFVEHELGFYVGPDELVVEQVEINGRTIDQESSETSATG